MRYWMCVCVMVVVGLSACGDDGEKRGRGPVDLDGDVGSQDAGTDAEPGSTDSGACSEGETQCRADGVYACDESGELQLLEACDNCEGAPSAHCPGNCADGVTSVCEGDSIRVCATDALQSCHGGRCVSDGEQGLCVAVNGAVCLGDSFELLCGDEEGVADDLVCDLRTQKCQPATFDCANLAGLGANEITCDASGNFLTQCVDGQPQGIVCEEGASCGADNSMNCYTAAQAGGACGGQTVCYPGLHCRQSSATQSACEQPAGQLACNSTDVLSVCTDQNTAVACVNGAVYWWSNLTTWGGSCSNNMPVIPEGGNCIPGVANCAQGLACDKTPYDIAGRCRTPAPNARPDCTLTNQASTGQSCVYAWDSCLDGKKYGVTCQRQNVGGHLITICSCYENGNKTRDFGSSELCGVDTTEDLDALAADGCEWRVTTVDVAP